MRIPDCYGPIIPRGVPDFSERKWKSENRRLGGVYFARPRGKKARTKFVEFLERNGFTCKEDEITSRESTIASKFPIRVDLDKKQYSHLNTVTSAAAVANSRLMYPVDRFYMLMECAYSFVVV